MTKLIERKPISLLERLYFPQILRGLKITFINFFKRKVTLQYPEEQPIIPEGYRGVPALIRDPEGREKCVSCQLCEFVCPSKAIRIRPSEIGNESLYQKIEKAPKEFDIDMLRCIYCGMCEQVCPEEAIMLQKKYSVSGYSRKDLVFNKQKLYELGGTVPDKYYKWSKK